jgi:tryptophan synthase alpha chain
VYYISRAGVTGMQAKVSDTIGEMVERIRAHTSLPIAVGFGISNPAQAVEAGAHTEAVVVGSAVVDRIAKLGKAPEMVPTVAAFVKTIAQALKS